MITYYAADDTPVACRFNFAIGRPFPDREVLIAECGVEHADGNRGGQWGDHEYGSMLVSARRDMAPILQRRQSLSLEYGLGYKINELARIALGPDYELERIYLLNLVSIWYKMKAGDRVAYVRPLPPAQVLSETEFQTLVDSRRSFFCGLGDFHDEWRNHLDRVNLDSRDTTMIPHHDLMPFVQWSYGCSPCSGSMLFTWWDHASEYYEERLGTLTDYYFERWDTIEDHWDYHVPNSNRELKIAMGTDGSGSTDIFDIDDGMINVGADNGYGVDSECLYFHSEWELWNLLTDEIDDEIPLLSGIDGHTMVGVGYNNDYWEYANNDPNYSTTQWLHYTTLDHLIPVHPYDGWGTTIKLTSPLGDPCWHSDCGLGEVFTGGDVCPITWTGDLNAPGTYASISYSLEGGSQGSWIEIDYNEPNDGSYDWIIPVGLYSLSCRVRVIIYDGNYWSAADGSWGDFQILHGTGLPELQEDVSTSTYTNPDFFKFHHTDDSWCAVGIRSEWLEGIWDIALYNDTTFVNLLTESTGAFDVNYVVMDGNNLVGIPHGIRVENDDGDLTAQIEYEGNTETITPGEDLDFYWIAGDVVEIWDVDLTSGDWVFDLEYTGGDADLDISLFYFEEWPYYGKRTDHFQNAFSTHYGYGVNESFTCTANEAGTYGFCVQARDGGEADFRITINPPGTWKGNVSSDWHDPANWAGFVVPDADTDVTITAGRPHNPDITAGSAYCHSLTIENGASLGCWQDLHASFGLDCAGSLVLLEDFIELDVSSGHVHWQTGAHFDAAPSTMTRVGGNWTVDSGTDITLITGTVIFDGYEASSIKNYDSGTVFYNLENSKNESGALYFSSYCTEDFEIAGDLILHTDAMLEGDSPHRVTLGGGLWKLSGSYFHFNAGEFCFEYSDSDLNPDAGDYFHQLTLSHSNIDMQDDLVINGNLTTSVLTTLDIWGFDMQLAGDWTNSAGAGVMPATSTGVVIVNGEDDQTFTGDFDLPTLRLLKPDGHLYCPTSSQITCDSYDWQNGVLDVNGGTFTALDIVTNTIRGNFLLSGGELNLYQDAVDYVDFDGNINISDGTMNIHGGYPIDSYWPYQQDAYLTMSGGVLDFKDNGIYVYNGANTLHDNITGGTIRTSGNFRGDRTDFNPGDGTIELYGSGDATLSHGIGSNFHDVTIDKASIRQSESSKSPGIDAVTTNRTSVATRYRHDGSSYPVSRNQEVIAGSTLDLDGNMLVQSGMLQTNGEIIEMGGYFNVYGSVDMTDNTGYIRTGSNIYWRNGSVANIDDGFFYCRGHWYFYDGCNVQLGVSNSVQMEGSSDRYILCYEETSSFNNLIVNKAAGSLLIHSNSTDTVRVTSLLNVLAGNTLDVLDGELVVEDEILLPDNAILQIGYNGSLTVEDIDIDGTLAVDNGSALVHGNFLLDTGGILNLTGGQLICDRAYTGNYQSIAGALYMNDGIFEVTNDGLQFGADNGSIISGGTISLGWGLQALYANSFQPNGGVVEFIGSTHAGIECSTGNYLHDLTINKSAGVVYLYDNLTLEGDLHVANRTFDMFGHNLFIDGSVTIETGAMLDSDNQNLSVGTSWINNRGDMGFLEGTGTVTFNTSEPAELSGETFNNLNIAKPLYVGYFLTLLEEGIVNVLNDLYIMDGTLLMTDNTTLAVDRDLVIELDAGLDAHQNYDGINISCGGNWINYNTTYDSYIGFNPGTSTVTFDGTADQYLLASTAVETLHNLTIDKSGGSFMPDSDLLVTGDCVMIEGSWWRLATGLTHTYQGDLILGGDCDWEDGDADIVFSGTYEQNLNLLGGYGFNSIYIDKGYSRIDESLQGSDQAQEVTRERSETINLLSNLWHSGNDALTINSGELNLNGYSLYYLSDADFRIEADGSLTGGPDSQIKMGDGTILRDYGLVELLGDIGHECMVTHYPGGSYSFVVSSGGTLSAEWTTFEHMGSGGISVTTSGLIDPDHSLHNCRFREGAAGSWLIRLDCDQDLNIAGARFPDNTWSGNYNVLKAFEPSPGNVINFSNATGTFAGEDYDNDPYNAITWYSAIDIVVTNCYWMDTEPAVGDSARLYISLNNPQPVDSGPFDIGIYYNQPYAPDWGDTPDQLFPISDLGGGAGFGLIVWVSSDLPGEWTSWILCDYDEQVEETNETNNLGGPTTVTWNSSLDLVITDCHWNTTDPLVGDSAPLYYSISNQGSEESGPFNIGIYYNQSVPPEYGDTPDWFIGLPSLAGSSSQNYTSWLTGETPENWETWILVDYDEGLVEGDEGNNVCGPSLISWQPLPPVDDLVISYNDQYNSIALHWSYPIWYSYFNIYRDTVPYFTPGPENLFYSAGNTNYSTIITTPTYFYKITAVREVVAAGPVAGIQPVSAIEVKKRE